jgi:hypothetical protein
MKKYFLLALLLPTTLILSNCTSDSQAGNKIKLPKMLPPLNSEDIYDKDKVTDYLFDNVERDTDSTQQASKRLFLLAIDFYKNKKNKKDAIPAFKKSIMLFPDAKAYNELGNLLYENNQYEECLKSYQMAVNMGYSPLADTYFNMACADASIENYSGSVYAYLDNAFKNGFNDSIRYVDDNHLSSIRSETYYRDFLFSNFAKGIKEENIKYELFLKEFTTLDLPYSIPSEKVNEYNHNSYIGYDFSDYVEEMENVSFGRDVSNEFCSVGILKQTANYTALLYSSVEMGMGDVYSPVHTMLATYNLKGELISKKVFACQCSGEKIKTGSYDGNIVTVEEQTVIWEKPFDSVSPDENKITSYEPVETTKYIIDESGTINLVSGS